MDLLRCNDPWQLSTDIGPLIDNTAHRSIDAYIKSRKPDVLHQRELQDKKGNFITPTLIEVGGIADLDGETFGPVLHLAKYKAGNFFKVIEDINTSGYGLTFGLHTRVDERVQDAVSAIDAGNIYINRNQIGAIVESQPFGGKKLSGTGPKAGGPHYLLRFLKESNVVANPGSEHSNDYRTESNPVTLQATNTGEPLIPHIESLRNTLPNTFSFCAEQVNQALQLAEAHFHPTIDLPGPTGESNRLSMEPAGTVLCLNSDNDAHWIAQSIQSLALGNAVVMVGKNAEKYGAAVKDWLKGFETSSLQAIDAALDSEAITHLLGNADFDAVAIANQPLLIKPLRKILAERDGPIVSVCTSLFDLSPLVDEKSLCIDTTAAGGNASLLAAAS